MPTTTGNSAGFDRIQYAVSTDGIPTDFSGIASDAVAGLSRLAAAQAADVSIPAPNVVTIPGDDGIDAQFLFDVTELESFEMTVGRSNYGFVNALQGTSTINLQSAISMLPRNPKGRDYPDMFFLLTRRAQLRDGSTGAGYEHVLVPKATVAYLGSPFETQGEGVYTYQVTANYVPQTFYGQALGAGGTEVGGKNEMSSFEMYSEYPVTVDVYKSDGTATSFTPSKTPRTGGLLLAWDAGDLALATAPTTLSVSLSEGDITFTAPDSGDYIIALYETVE